MDIENRFVILTDSEILRVFLFLDIKDLVRASFCCSRFNRVSSFSFLWRSFLLRRWLFSDDPREITKQKFIQLYRRTRFWEEGRAGSFSVTSMRGHNDYISDLSIDGNRIITSSADGTVCIWDPAVGGRTAEKTLKMDNLLPISAFKTLGDFIITGNTNGEICIWSKSQSTLVHQIQAHQRMVTCIACDEDSQSVISGGEDGRLICWDLLTGTQKSQLENHLSAIQSIHIFPEYILTMSNQKIQLWDKKRNASRHIIEIQNDIFRIGPSFSCLTVVNKEIFVGNTQGEVHVYPLIPTGTFRTYQPTRLLLHPGPPITCISSVVFDGRALIAAVSDRTIQVFSSDGQNHLSLQGHSGRVNSIELDGLKLVSGSADNTIKVWDLKTGQEKYTLLGGSLQRRQNDPPPHPTRHGCSFVHFDDSSIVASFGHVLKVFRFSIPNA